VAVGLTEEVAERIHRLELPFNAFGVDPYGVSKKHLAIAYTGLGFFYRTYFRCEAFGLENVPQRGRGMLIGNHSGGVALDAAMTIATMFFAMDTPRLAQGMAEKFINTVPFVSTWSARTGQFTGLPEHCVRLLEDDRLLLVFPEGARGTAKLYRDRYSLVKFGTGFMRIAMKTKSPIIPFGFLGGGSAIPTIANSQALGRLVGAPYVPITPWGAAVPLPVKLEVEFGEPMHFEGTGSEDDEVIAGYVEQVRSRIAEIIERGRRRRAGNGSTEEKT